MSTSTRGGRERLGYWPGVATMAVLVAFAWLGGLAAAQEAGKAKKSAPAAKAGKASAPKAARPAASAKTEAAEPAEAASASPAAPVKYKQDMSSEEYGKALEKFKREKSNVQKMLRGQTFAAGQEAQFDAYYSEFALPRWTVPENYTSLPDFRREIRNELFAGKSGPPYDRLLSLAFDFLSKVSGPGYHPAVRYNAMTMLGDLNVQENPPGSRTPLQPHPGALKVLVGAVKSSDSDAVRVAALLGLLRHASLGIADAQIRDGELTPTLLDLVKSSPPQGRLPEGHAWLRALAIDVLAALHSVGPNGSVAIALVGIVGDKNAPMLTRCAAARALGTFDYAGTRFNALTASQLAAPIGQLAVEMCTAELKKTKSTAKAAAKPGFGGMGSMPGSMPMGAMPMGSMPGMAPYGARGAQKTPEDEESDERTLHLRRNLKYYLAAARLGLNGPSDGQNGGIRLFSAKGNTDPKAVASADDPDWKFVDNLFKALQEQIKNLDDKDAEYDTIAKEVVASRNKLNDLLKGGPSAPPPAPTGPAKGARGGAAKK